MVKMKFNLNIIQLFFFSEYILYSNGLYGNTCAEPDSFVRGSNFENLFFLVDEWRKDPNTTLSGQSSARQPNAI